ncbi:MAG: hypothetical protein ACR2FG_14235 [Marmoricola sp.]
MTDYPVVLLIEQELTAQDARQVRGLHDEIEETVRYHVLLPVQDAALRVQSAMGTLGTGDMMSTGMVVDPDEGQELQSDLQADARTALAHTIAAIEAAGGRATGELLSADPVEGLVAKVKAVDARETIILTSSHVVSEFFHLDWTSRARRKLGVPVLHLLEHENFDEQSGQGEGTIGI